MSHSDSSTGLVPTQPLTETHKASWRPHPQCPEYAVQQLRGLVASFPAAWFVIPTKGDKFASIGEALERLQGFAITQGFAVANISGSMESPYPYFVIACLHHGKATRNWRKLEDHVLRDEEGQIVSNRKYEETSVQAKDCKVAWAVSYKQVPRGSGVYHFVITKCPTFKHSHELASNPLRYRVVEKLTAQYATAVQLARTHREAFLTFNASIRILDQMGLTIDRGTYYNIKHRPISDSNNGFQAIICALEDEGFVYRARFEDAVTSDGIVIPGTRQCQQIWCALPRQIEYARRFVPGFVILLDGTFKTNNLDLILLVVNGVTNTGKTFPVCFSFIRSEAKISIDFVFRCLKDLVLGVSVGGKEGIKSGLPYGKPKVAISDQAPGIINSTKASLPDIKLQFCEWHAVENIQKRLAEKRYTKEERKLVRQATWEWIKARTDIESVVFREVLDGLLRQGEIDYINEWWAPRAQQLLRIYTRKYANLGCFSNQRSEGSNVKVKVILHHQLPLDETCRRLASTITTDLRTLDRLESEEGGDLPRTLDTHAFRRVADTVTRYAIDLVSPEWEATKVAVDSGELLYESFTDNCQLCELPLRWGLPCRHTLCLIYLRGNQLPKSLFHRRWWIYGPAIIEEAWQPSYESIDLPFSPPRRGTVENTLTSGQLQVLNERETLTPGARAEYDEMMMIYQQTMINTASFLRQREGQMVTEMIPRNEKKKWLQPKTAHAKTTARALTSAEITAKEADKVEIAAEKAEKIRAQVERAEQLETQDTIVVAPKVLVPRSPMRQPTPTQASPEAPDPLPLASTAPQPITEAITPRRRVKRKDYRGLLGLPPAKRRQEG